MNMPVFLLLMVLLFNNSKSVLSDETVDQNINVNNQQSKPIVASKEQFKILFKEKRTQQLSAVKRLQSFGKYEQKYSMVSSIFEKLFEVQEKAKQIVENSSYVLGLDLPKDQSLLESLSGILENCAFFGDIVLKLPDISHRILKQNQKFVHLYKWCISFSTQTNLIDDNTAKMFDLVAQELDIIPKNESYVNPYKTSNKKVKIESQVNSDPNVNNNKKKKGNKKVKKGPRLSRGTEL